MDCQNFKTLFLCLSLLQVSCSGRNVILSQDTTTETSSTNFVTDIEVTQVVDGVLPIRHQPQLLKVEELHGSFRELYKSWDSFNEQQKKDYFDKRFNDDHYWGYFFSEWGRNYFYTENPKIKRIFRQTLEFVISNYNNNGVLQAPTETKSGHWYRETFARNNRLLFDAWINTKEPLALGTVENQAGLWIKMNPRQQNHKYKIFPYSYKLNDERSGEINPNQNLQLALVFSHLYFEPASKYYLDPQMRDLAYNEIEATLSLVRSDGFFPLNQNAIDVGDSNYAGLSSTILYQLVQMWGEPDWIEHLQKIGIWLNTAFDESRPWNTIDDGEDYHFDQFSAFNLFARIPAFYAAGVPAERAQEWMRFVTRCYPAFEILGTTPRWDYLLTLPESYYSDIKRTNNLKVYAPQVYLDKKEDLTVCNVVGHKIIKILIDGNEIPVEDNRRKLSLSPGAEIKVMDGQGQETILAVPWISKGKDEKWVIRVFDIDHPIQNK